MLPRQRVELELEKLLKFVQTLPNLIISFSVIRMAWCARPYITPAEIGT